MKAVIALADTVPEALEEMREVQQRMVDFEVAVRELQDRNTEDLAKLQGELARAEGKYRNACLAAQKILAQVPMRFRDEQERAGVALRAHDADVTRARQDADACRRMLEKRQEDVLPSLGEDERKSLMDQATRADVAYKKVTARHEELQAAVSRADLAVASEVAKVRKAAQ